MCYDFTWRVWDNAKVEVYYEAEIHDARKMIQTSEIHDARKMIQTSRAHDARKMIQVSKIHDAHKMKSLSKVFFYCYKIANDQKNSLFCYCVQFKLST